MAKCDFDCFNCKFDDCVSGSSYNPLKTSSTLSASAKNEERLRKRREYYQAKRKELIEKSSKYYYEHREEVLKKKKERLNANKGE